MSYNPVQRMWSIKAVHSLAEMEEVLNELQDDGYKIHEVNVEDLVVVYYKEKQERIDE
jgi:tRNA G18 (ribose-2'-O)-methylase SpoU